MKNYKRRGYILISFLISFIFISNTFAEEAFELKYIKSNSNTYNFYSSDFGSDVSAIKLFVDGKEIPGIEKSLNNDGFLEVKNFYKSSGDINFEKTISIEDSSGKPLEKSIKSNILKIKREDNTILRNSINTEYRSGKDMVNIYFEKGFQDWFPNFDTRNIEKSGSININGKDFDLLKDSGVYEYNKYYYNNKYITFATKNLTDINNIIKLKIDGAYSNYVSINKEKYKIEKPFDYIISDYNNTKLVKFRFSQPEGITNLNGFDIYVNDKKIDNKDASLGLGLLIINLDLSKFTKDDNVAKIYLVNTTNNYFSNTLVVNMEKLIENKIESIDLGNGEKTYFNCKIKGSQNGFMGDIYKLKININGQDYSKEGVKEILKDSGGNIMTDVYGNQKYEMKNKIDFYRIGGNSIEFAYEYSKFGTGTNIIFVKNENTGRESNRISFDQGNYTNIDYNNMMGLQQTNTGKENIIFENGLDFLDKKIDFLNKPEKDIILGKLNLNNLKQYDTYNISFKIKTNIKTNPFYDLKLDTVSLDTNQESDGTISYNFDKILLGKDFKSGNLIANLNDLFNIIDGKNIKFILGNFSIKKYDRDGNLTELFSNKNSTEINFGYLYDFGSCFDGEKDYCGIEGINDPGLIESIAFGKDINIIETLAISNQLQNFDSQVIGNNKKNASIYNFDFKNEKFKVRNQKFITLYDKLKTKSFTSRQLTSLKLGINNILQGLKDLEDRKPKIEAMYLIKTNLKSIVTIIKSLEK